jgi:hypothetical protein
MEAGGRVPDNNVVVEDAYVAGKAIAIRVFAVNGIVVERK